MVSFPEATSSRFGFRLGSVPFCNRTRHIVCMWWNCLASWELYLSVWALHSSDNFSCPYFSIAVVGDKCCSFLIDGRVDCTVRESSLLCRVGMIAVLKRYTPHFTEILNPGSENFEFYPHIWIKSVTPDLAAWFRLWSDATGKAETRCLKGDLSPCTYIIQSHFWKCIIIYCTNLTGNPAQLKVPLAPAK